MGTRVEHKRIEDGWHYRSYAYADNSIPDLDQSCMFQSEHYVCGSLPPHYPVPAKRRKTFEYWRNLGEVSALNGFDVEIVQRLNRYR